MKLMTVFCGLIFVLTVWATEVTTYTGSATQNRPLHVALTTLRDGNVSARAQWVPKPGTEYALQVKRLTNPSDPFSYTHICQVHSNQPNVPPPGDWACTIPNSPAGFHSVDFFPTSGKTNGVVITVTAETDE